jgi:fucose permease
MTPVLLCYSIAGLTVIALVVNIAAKMPSPSGEASFRVSEVPALLSRPALLLLSLFLFLYVACEVGVWNWLKTYLITLPNFKDHPAAAGGAVSYGFAFGILMGRVVVSRVLIKVPALTVLLIASALMASTTLLMLNLDSQIGITVAVFCAGLSMAPVFPTVLALTGDAFRRGTATAMGIAITCGWIGLAVSSPIIGQIEATSSLRSALFLIPGFSVAMVVASLVLRKFTGRPVTE